MAKETPSILQKAQQTTRRYASEVFRRKKLTLYRQAATIQLKCDADIYILIRRADRHFEFSSTLDEDDRSWPLRKEAVNNLSREATTTVVDFPDILGDYVEICPPPLLACIPLFAEFMQQDYQQMIVA